MKRWLRRIGIVAVLLAIGWAIAFEAVTRVGRGWWHGEPFYDGRPASYWANEIDRWETQDPDWRTRTYARRATWPDWVQRQLPEPRWPALLDGDPDALAVLRALANHPSPDVQDWARIGIERLDNFERGPYKIKHHDSSLLPSCSRSMRPFTAASPVPNGSRSPSSTRWSKISSAASMAGN